MSNLIADKRLYRSIYEKYLHLNETSHVFTRTNILPKKILNRIRMIPTINIDEDGYIDIDDNIINDIDNHSARYKFSTGYSYKVNSDKPLDFVTDEYLKLCGIYVQKLNLEYITIQPDDYNKNDANYRDINYNKLSNDDYVHLNICHRVFVNLIYDDKINGSISREKLVGKKEYMSMSEEDKSSYIKSLMSDAITITVNLKQVSTVNELLVILQHECTHLFMLCDPKRRFIEEVDFDDYNKLIEYIKYKNSNVEKYIHIYNAVNYFLLKNEQEARLNSIKSFLYNHKKTYRKWINDNPDASTQMMIRYIMSHMKDHLQKSLVFNDKIEAILYFSKADDVKETIINSQRYKTKKDTDNAIQAVIAFRLLYAIYKGFLNSTPNNVISSYIKIVLERGTNISEMLRVDDKIKVVASKIEKLYNEYQKYLRRISKFIYYFCTNELFLDTEEDMQQNIDDEINRLYKLK